MEADRPQIVCIRKAQTMKDEKDKKPKKDENAQGRCIQTPRPPDAPEGSYFDQEDCVWKDSQGNPLGG